MTRWPGGMPFLSTLVLTLMVMASALSSRRAAADDMLILTDGMKTGSVERYAGGVCTFDGAPVPRASIYYIGLDADLPPPTPRDPMRDEVHLRDGSVHPGPLVSIDAANVATETAIHPREKVAWIWLTPVPPGQGQAAPPSTAEEPDRRTYEWVGIIKVENRYAGRAGRHLWQAEYRVKLLEVPTNSTKPGRYPLAVSFPTNALEPIEIEYEIKADQNWDGEGYKIAYGANNVLISGDVTMRGRAGGRISGQTLVDSRVLLGDLLRLDAPAAAPQPPTAGITTQADYDRYLENAYSPVEPGWYYISIGFGGHDMDYGGKTGPPARLLSVYDGIVRGGLHPPFFDDPYLDFVHWIPAYGSDVVMVGRLDDPDQATVRGALNFARDANVGPGEHITIEWSFTRTRQ